MTLSEERTAELESLKRRLDDIENRVSEASDEDEEEDEAEDEDGDGGQAGPKGKKFIVILKDICRLVRRATAASDPQLAEIVEAAQKILNQGVSFAYGDSDMFDFLPSWAHDAEAGEPLIRDREETDLPPMRE